MSYRTAITNPETRPSTGPRSLVLYGIFAALMFPAHESAHYATYRILGIPIQMTLNTASPADHSQRRPIAELAGPLLNLGFAAVAAVVYQRRHVRKRWLAELALASAMMRLVIYVLVVGAALVTGSGLSLGNDEPIAANLWKLPSLTFLAVFAVPFLGIVGFIVQASWRGWRRRALHVLARGLVTLGVGILVGNVLDPWLFPHR